MVKSNIITVNVSIGSVKVSIQGSYYQGVETLVANATYPRGTNGGFEFHEINPSGQDVMLTNSTQYLNNSFVAIPPTSGTYQFYVIAYDSYGDSTKSNTISQNITATPQLDTTIYVWAGYSGSNLQVSFSSPDIAAGDTVNVSVIDNNNNVILRQTITASGNSYNVPPGNGGIAQWGAPNGYASPLHAYIYDVTKNIFNNSGSFG